MARTAKLTCQNSVIELLEIHDKKCVFNVPHLTPIIQRNQQVYFSEAHEMLMETACCRSACAFLELKKKNSRKQKYSFPSPQSLPEANGFFSCSLKIHNFYTSPLLPPAFIPHLLWASPQFRCPIPAKLPLCTNA